MEFASDDGRSLWEQLMEDRRLMRLAPKEIAETGVAYAKANAEYQMAKSKRSLEMRADGMPVTLIELTVRGDEEVVGYYYDLLAKEALYTAAQRAQTAYQKDFDFLVEQFSLQQKGM